MSAPGVGVCVSQHALRQTPPLLTESQTPVKTLPWPNFVAAGNYVNRPLTYFSGANLRSARGSRRNWGLCCNVKWRL